jgi:hypothetical protein
MYRKQFIPLPRLQHTHIALSPSAQKTTDVYPPANYMYTHDGIEFECPHCNETITRLSSHGEERVKVGVYEVFATFHHCPSCSNPVFTVSPFDISKYWSK